MTSKRDIIKRWIQKVESDLKTARILMEFEGSPTESICFHSQQAVEKLLKAYLTFTDTRVGKTHDIATLLELCVEVDIRYPDTSFFRKKKPGKF